MNNNIQKMIVIVSIAIFNIILIISVIISVSNTINNFKEKEKNGLLSSKQTQDNMQNTEAEYDIDEEDSISLKSLIENGYIGLSEIIKIILLLIAIILLSLGAYIFVKIKH